MGLKPLEADAGVGFWNHTHDDPPFTFRLNEEMEDYPDYEFHISIQDAELVKGLTIKSATLDVYSLGNYSTNSTPGGARAAAACLSCPSLPSRGG